jgi:hypothetical protein
MSYNKYRVSNKADRTLDGIVFGSKLEMNRYAFLKMFVGTLIFDLVLQPSFELIPKFEYRGVKYPSVKYKADFQYSDKYGNKTVEETKGMETRDYKIRRAILLTTPRDFVFREIKDSADQIGN